MEGLSKTVTKVKMDYYEQSGPSHPDALGCSADAILARSAKIIGLVKMRLPRFFVLRFFWPFSHRKNERIQNKYREI